MRMVTANDEILDPDEKRRILRRTWHGLRPWRGVLVVATLLILVQTVATLAGPAILAHGVDEGIREGDLDVIRRDSVLFLLAAATAYAAGWGAIVILARAGEGWLRDLRDRTFAHVTDLSMSFFDRNRTGALVSRLTADVEALQQLISQGLVLFFAQALILVGAIVVMFTMSWQLALVTMVVVPFLWRATSWFQRESNRAYLTLRERIGSTLTSLQEGLSGVRVVQAFAQEGPLLERFHGTNEAQYEAHLRAERIASIYTPAIELSHAVVIAGILGMGGFLVNAELATIGVVSAFILYLQRVFEPIQQLSQFFNQIQASGAALKKLYALLDEGPDVEERPGAVDLPPQGDLEVDRASFGYGTGRDTVLHDVSLTLRRGERLALVGPTGAGKSTLAKLVVRFYDPTEGAVRFGGVDLRDATLSSLRQRIVVVPQEGFLFGGSIRDNVRIGRISADDGEVDDAIRALGLLDRFAAFPHGLETEVVERGANFSAGERQLVSLARAALADPALIVLDEATSSLDPGTELLVEEALDVLMRGRAVVVVAHRLSTAARADRVGVVVDGSLVEIGTHEDLLGAGGAYAALFGSWSGLPTPPAP
jgi:ATP-binding cassette subfamily B protein